MKDYSLSPVFNVRGRELVRLNDSCTIEPIYNGTARVYIPIDK
jgi:hypothetical protein